MERKIDCSSFWTDLQKASGEYFEDKMRCIFGDEYVSHPKEEVAKIHYYTAVGFALSEDYDVTSKEAKAVIDYLRKRIHDEGIFGLVAKVKPGLASIAFNNDEEDE